MAARTRCLIAALVLITSLGLVVSSATPVSATTTWQPVVARIVNVDGRAQYPSNLIACPYVGASYDCSERLVQPTGRSGHAVLRLDQSVRYHLFAAVVNPNPPWPCPVLTNGSDIVYLSNESFDGLPNQLPRLATFTVVEPDPGDCAPIRVVDDAGNPVPGAGLFVNGDARNGVTDSQGIINVRITPGATYEVGAYLSNSGWPCPTYTSPDGSTFHFSERRTVTAEQLSAGATTFVIRKPDPSECAPPPPTLTGAIRMFDEAGSPLPQAIVGYCEYDPATPPSYPNDPGTDCPRGSGFRAPDADGVIRVPVSNPHSKLDITGYLSCANGWYLFGDYNSSTDNGYTFWTITASDLVTNGLDLKILGDAAACLTPAPPS